jgi:hypothetical protein
MFCTSICRNPAEAEANRDLEVLRADTMYTMDRFQGVPTLRTILHDAKFDKDQVIEP